jgi:hypothetical protein
MSDFVAWPKTARLFKDCIITEKIDGTNACIVIGPGGVWAQSRTRIITPGKDDNYGFAGWVAANLDTLTADLGEGRHYGEWWGKGVQRSYGLNHRRFSLFNTVRWDEEVRVKFTTPCLDVVPELCRGPFSTEMVDHVLRVLSHAGSEAALRVHSTFPRPEGVIVRHVAAGVSFKAFCDGEGQK